MTDSVSEADGSEGPSNSSKSSEQQKKERIRDNQRRSRARRQEHLADLEQRLAAYHTTCREADMQRAAFRDAQIENTRLRDLLKIAGVNEALTQSYINQGINQAQNADSSHRTIRPRMPIHQEETRSGGTIDESMRASPFSDISAMSRLNVEPEPIPASTRLSSNYSPQTFQPLPMTPQMLQQGSHMQHLSIFQPSSSLSDDLLCCGAFQVPSNAPYEDPSENTILCTEAKNILEHYHVNPTDMEWIKNRLAGGISKPLVAGQSCRVNSQLLLQVLNEISVRRSA